MATKSHIPLQEFDKNDTHAKDPPCQTFQENGQEDELILMTEKYSIEEVEALCDGARRIWHHCCYGSPKAAYKQRCTANVSNKRKFAEAEKGWIERRRMQVEALAKGVDTNVLKKRRPGWSAAHQKELDFQNEKQARYFVDAVLDGSVDVNDLSDEAATIILQEIQRREKRRKVAKKIKMSTPHLLETIFKHVFVAEDVEADRTHLQRLVQSVRGGLVDEPVQASLFIVATPVALPARTRR